MVFAASSKKSSGEPKKRTQERLKSLAEIAERLAAASKSMASSGERTQQLTMILTGVTVALFVAGLLQLFTGLIIVMRVFSDTNEVLVVSIAVLMTILQCVVGLWFISRYIKRRTF